MMPWLLVFLGGGTGALLRHGIGKAVGGTGATLLVNVTGCFLMGLLAGWLMGREQGESWRLLLGVGLLGGFTTFSAFALDFATLWRDQPWVAIGYCAASVLGSLAAMFAGLSLSR
ncbi:fluoride efflux transporter FluC [Sphingomonas arenae]|uniref:fluoride efflux transporter FluC n=1 Tax=Sphingomonas arenae TaxID=2812555 RepID=UPI001967C4CC|nr:CrcB family protein [Sphingomonas arenae]